MRDLQINPNNEPVICHTKRHPFGILQFYIGVGGVLLIVAVVLATALPTIGVKPSAAQMGMIWGLYGLFVGIMLLFTLVYRYIYWGSELHVTDNEVTQVMHIGLFNRKFSRLDMENVEDVTSAQRGIIQSMFNFGTLTVETAGEQTNFSFPFCPNPNALARQIHDAKQAHMNRHAQRMPQYAMGMAPQVPIQDPNAARGWSGQQEIPQTPQQPENQNSQQNQPPTQV